MEEPSQKTEVIASSWFYLGEQESKQARKEFLENRRILTIRAAQGEVPASSVVLKLLATKVTSTRKETVLLNLSESDNLTDC